MTASNPLAERRLKGQADGRGDLQLQPLRESLLFSNRTGFGPRPAVSLYLPMGQFCLWGVVLLLPFLVEKSRTPPNTSSCTYTHLPVTMFWTVTEVPSFPLWAEGPVTEE